MNIYIEVIGCTANHSDASIARHQIEQHQNFLIVDNVDNADIILLFTCTVISATEQRMYSKIEQYVKQKKRIIVTGCMASVQSEHIKKINEDIICIPPLNIHRILSYLDDSKKTSDRYDKYQSKKRHSTIFAPISISEGCDFSCAYCITTLARGKLTSYPKTVIKANVEDAIKQGCKEIQLTAQDTASYGMDTGSNLTELLSYLADIKGWYRFRIGMMNPATLRPQIDQMIDSFIDIHIYKFLHIPIQSGDNQLLLKMKRRYTIQDVFNIVNIFRKQFPDITIATDVIVGFPSENEDQYLNTKIALKKIDPDIVNITKFSARPNTKAKTMKKRIPTEIVKARSKEVTNLTSSISYQKNRCHIGKRYTILITEKGKKQSMIGRTNQYKPVVLHEPVSIGEVVDVEIIDSKQTHIVGMLK